MNIFNSEDYREIVRNLLSHRQKHSNRISLAKLADICGVQRPYVSQVLAGKADFSADQLFAICQFLNLSDEECEYLNLVLEHARSGRASRKLWLLKKIRKIRDRNLSTARVIPLNRSQDPKEVPEVAAYYLDPLLQRIHILVSIPRYRSNLPELAMAAHVSEERTSQALFQLADMGLLVKVGQEYQLSKKHIHLHTDSPYCLPHQILLRTQSLAQLQNLGGGGSFRYSLTFSGSTELEFKIREAFLKLISELQSPIDESPAEKLLQINFDLFPWSV